MRPSLVGLFRFDRFDSLGCEDGFKKVNSL